MKLRAILAAVLLIFSCSIAFAAVKKENTIDAFIKKAAIAEKDIRDAGAKLAKLKKDFNETGGKIEALKNMKQQGGIGAFINGMKLKYHLSCGNALGYKIYRLEDGIRELKIEHFTYASLVAEEYGKMIIQCWQKKCPDMAGLAEKRGEWAVAADKYGDFLQIDLSSLKLIKDYSKGAEKDIKEYLNKKIVQAEQRIYLLEEEKGLLEIMKKAGLSGAAEKKKNADKISELKKLKKKLQDEMKKIK